MKFFLNLNNRSQKEGIKAVLFDIFGTVVDWRETLVKELDRLFNQKGISNINSEEFVEIWVSAYSENMKQISSGQQSFALLDELNHLALNKTLQQYTIFDPFTDEEREQMWMLWHQLKPWQDSVSGISKIKKHAEVGTLSNGNIALLQNLSKNAGFDWDHILSGESFRCYKPNPSVYLNAAKKLKLQPSEILLVASHKYDLEAARQCGYQTAYIFRPLEFRTIEEEQRPKDNEFDFMTDTLDDLAEQLNELSLKRSDSVTHSLGF